MNKLATTITTLALGGTLLLGAGVTSAAAQGLPSGTASSPMLSASMPQPAPINPADAAYRKAFLKSLPTVRVGSSGGAVLALQIGLNAAGTHPQLRGTGYFGPVTQQAVKAFQRSHGLVADGIVGPRTWNALVAPRLGTNAEVHNPQLRPGQPWSEAQADESGSVIVVLDLLRDYTAWAPEQLNHHTRYDNAEVAGIKGIQQRSGITPSGILGARTARVLTMIVAVIEQYGD